MPSQTWYLNRPPLISPMPPPHWNVNLGAYSWTYGFAAYPCSFVPGPIIIQFDVSLRLYSSTGTLKTNFGGMGYQRTFTDANGGNPQDAVDTFSFNPGNIVHGYSDQLGTILTVTFIAGGSGQRQETYPNMTGPLCAIRADQPITFTMYTRFVWRRDWDYYKCDASFIFGNSSFPTHFSYNYLAATELMRVKKSSGVIAIPGRALADVGAIHYPLRICKNGTIYAVEHGDTNDRLASPVRFSTPSGVKNMLYASSPSGGSGGGGGGI